ncbi:MAG: hypothetical protein ACYCWE_08840 [Eubacteriales bacterium]
MYYYAHCLRSFASLRMTTRKDGFAPDDSKETLTSLPRLVILNAVKDLSALPVIPSQTAASNMPVLLYF